MEDGYKGHISIAALTTSSAVLSRCLAAFSARYPDITVDINFTSGRSQVVAMNEEKYDFHFAVQEMVPAGDIFDYLVSNTDNLCMAFPKDHPLADQPLDFSKLTGERFIAVSENDGPALYGEIAKVCAARGYKPNITCQYDRAEAVLLSVGAGLGISIIPEAISRVFYAENVSFTRIPGDDTLRTYVIAWHRNMTNPAARLFLAVVRKLF
jgi:DNA-binding transcriptional LysR family regulator